MKIFKIKYKIMMIMLLSASIPMVLSWYTVHHYWDLQQNLYPTQEIEMLGSEYITLVKEMVRIQPEKKNEYQNKLRDVLLLNDKLYVLEQNQSFILLSLQIYHVLFLGIGVLIAILAAWFFARRINFKLNRVHSTVLCLGKTSKLNLENKKWGDELDVFQQQLVNINSDLLDYQTREANLTRIASWQETARIMAHEIRNPLTPIQLLLRKVVNNYTGKDTKYSSLLLEVNRMISEELLSLAKMADQFSEFAKMPEIRIEDCQIDQLIKDFVTTYENSWSNLTIQVSVPVLTFSLDPLMMKQVLRNLLKNASESTSDQVTVQISVSQDDSGMLITLENNGPPVSSEILPTIFDKYVSSKKRDGASGIGLGLAFCQAAILKHYGILRVENITSGVRFTIWLPCRKDDSWEV